MKNILAATALGLFALGAHSAAAETCGGVYTVKRGDSLSLIADHLYKDVGKWSLIHNRNIGSIGEKPNSIRVGMKLDIACVDGLPTGLEGGRTIADAAPVAAQPITVAAGHASVRHKINLLTGGNYPPFTDKGLHNGGFLTDLVNSAMIAENPDDGFAIHWVDDWGAHFEPLLSNALLDAGFPWYKPHCASLTDNYRCDNLLFSEPLFETLTLMFAATSNPIIYNTDDDMHGKKICQPAGYDSSSLDADGRDWVKDGKVEIIESSSVDDCFEMILAHEADAIVLNEFNGRAKIKELGIKDQVQVVPHPLEIDAFHMVVHKSHPEAELILDTINDGLRLIHENGTYQEIVEDHLARIWADF